MSSACRCSRRRSCSPAAVISAVRRELLIAAGPGEWRAAWLEDGVAAELYVERGDTAPAGSIHLGRVVRLVAGLDAALVDIGEERPAFLPLRAPARRRSTRARGFVVQVRREAQRGKAAQLSGRLRRRDAARLMPSRGQGRTAGAALPGAGFRGGAGAAAAGHAGRWC